MSIPKELLAMFEKMMNPAAYPLQPLMFPVSDPAELEKKINELRTVKTWLEASVITIDLSIQAFEYQKSLLAPLAAGGKNQSPFQTDSSSTTPVSSGTADGRSGEGEKSSTSINPAVWAWDMMQKAASSVQATVAAAAEQKNTAAKKTVKKATKKATNKITQRVGDKREAKKN
jgi:hypothetical protein